MLTKGFKGDHSLVIRKLKWKIEFPSVARTLKEFKTFEEKHKVSLVGVNIDKVLETWIWMHVDVCSLDLESEAI